MTRSTLDDDQEYRLVFPGNVLPGTDYDEVVSDLALLLKTAPDSAIKLVSGKRRYVKRTFIYEKADQLRVKILQIGVECEIEPVDESAGTPKTKKKKHKKPFPKPENLAMQPVAASEEVDQEKSYSETMAEFQKHASVSRMQDTEKEGLDEAVSSFNSVQDQDQDQDQAGSQGKKLDEKSSPLHGERRRLAQFVGENVDIYLKKFEKFQQGGAPHFVFTWHWPAFFVPFFWAIYRKLWVWAIVIFISTVFWPLTNILWATVANYIYYRHSMKKIKIIQKRYLSAEVEEKLEESGGTSMLALSAALLVILLLMNGVYWTSKLSPVFSTLNENLEKIEQTKSQQQK
ncbi:MAG: DUF2628 domain-containing protein [Arenicellales bacterium]